MRFRAVTGSVLASTLAVAAGLVATVAPASAAGTTALLEGATGVGDVAAGGGHVFVATDQGVVVADTEGTPTSTINLPGAAGLALTPDSTRLYAALRNSNEVAEIATDTLAVVRRIALANNPCPSHLALAGTRLWVGYGCGQAYGGVVGLDVSVADPQPYGLAFNMYGAPVVAAAGGTVVTGELGLGPGKLEVYDVSTTPATKRGEISGHTYGLGDLNDIAISADGSTVYSAFNRPNQFDAWDTTTLTRIRSFGANETSSGIPKSVALSPDGAHLAGGRISGPFVSVFDVADTTPTYADTNPTGETVPRSLAFSGTDVFSVLRGWSNGQFYLWRLTGALLPPSTLALTPPAEATALAPLTLTGRLTLSDGSAPGKQPLVVTRQLPDGTRSTLDGVTTAADGRFTVTDTVSIVGDVRYDVYWDGTPAFRWSSTSLTVTVAPHPSSLTLSGPTSGTNGRPLTFTGVLDLGGLTPPAGTTIDVWRDVTNRTGTSRTYLPTVTPASDGSFSFVDTPPTGGQYTYSVHFWTNPVFQVAYASHKVSVRGAGA
ncbi:hypothetical protein [Micromonospora echinaurantiaca]|uniref:hypothetical protein n=1 Tax=Micromonospora echinaurantiaca TaxID=47857 RepID=UPI0037A34897